MTNIQDSFETLKRSFISAFLICMTVPLMISLAKERYRYTSTQKYLGNM